MKVHLALISIFLIVYGCSSTSKVMNENGEIVKVKCQPIYGNWCGKGYPAYEVTGYMPHPVDVWDEACMEHDLCYDKYGENGKEKCDRRFSRTLERLDRAGIPAPHQIINAYNYFKENKPYRHVNITFKDLWNANTVSCEGGEGLPTLFCDVRRGRNNCEISMGYQGEGAPCFCDYPTIYGPYGIIPGGRFLGRQKTADDF